MIWSKTYNGNAYTQMPVDLSGASPGVYIIKLQYTHRTVVQKIVKE
ncbi:MAG: T9SS type A sorting domain-containing protein [Ginsengibacter sp.]